jgi:hypothetical protein
MPEEYVKVEGSDREEECVDQDVTWVEKDCDPGLANIYERIMRMEYLIKVGEAFKLALSSPSPVADAINDEFNATVSEWNK